MKNLEKFGVQELDAVEVQSIEGGYEGGPGWGWALALAMYITDNWDDMSAGWNQYGNGECLS